MTKQNTFFVFDFSIFLSISISIVKKLSKNQDPDSDLNDSGFLWIQTWPKKIWNRSDLDPPQPRPAVSFMIKWFINVQNKHIHYSMPCTVYCLPVEGSAELVSHSSPVAQRRTAPPWPTVTRPAWPPVAVRPAGAWAHRGSTRRPDPQRERGWAAEGMRRRWPPCRPLAGTRTYRNMGLLKSSKSKKCKSKAAIS